MTWLSRESGLSRLVLFIIAVHMTATWLIVHWLATGQQSAALTLLLPEFGCALFVGVMDVAGLGSVKDIATEDAHGRAARILAIVGPGVLAVLVCVIATTAILDAEHYHALGGIQWVFATVFLIGTITMIGWACFTLIAWLIWIAIPPPDEDMRRT